MKKHLLILFVFIASLGAGAQTYNSEGIIIPPKSLRSDFASTYEAGGYINNMLGKINWQENFQVREQNGINNAYATIIRNQRYIVYDNRFLESLDRYAGTKWASISVLAHEVGHHYYNHVVNGSGSSLDKELEADYFSGYIMAQLGASLDEARAAMSQIASPYASSTHPGKADRLNAIAKGWNSTGISQNGTPVQIPTPTPAPQPRRDQQQRRGQQPQQPSSNEADWIQLSLYGNQNMTVYLSDDGRTFNTADIKTSEPFVFKFDVYDYGWLRFGNNRNARVYKLYHGRDYAIVWNRRTASWTLLEIS